MIRAVSPGVPHLEPGHEAVKALLPKSGGIASALHARSEFASIVHRHRRERFAPDELLVELHEQFLDECRAGHIHLLPHLGQAVPGESARGGWIESIVHTSSHLPGPEP
jgi:hypothetical protein